MNPNLKQKWIDALLSDKYKQGLNRLRTYDNRFCCLGALCNIINPNGWVQNRWGDYVFRCESDLMEKVLSPAFRTATKLSNSYHATLTRLNDTETRSFKEIADWIKNNIEESSDDPDVTVSA